MVSGTGRIAGLKFTTPLPAPAARTHPSQSPTSLALLLRRETLERQHESLGLIEELLSRAEDRGDESMKQAMNNLWDSILTTIRTR